MMHDDLHRLILNCRDELDELCRLGELLQIAVEQLGTSDHEDRLYLLIDAYRTGITLSIDEMKEALMKMTVLLGNCYRGDSPSESP